MSYSVPTAAAGALRLHMNENTAGCSAAVLAAIRGTPAEVIAAYPDYAAVTAACERHFGVGAGWVRLTNGLDEAIQAVALASRQEARVAARAERGADALDACALIVEPAFEMYAACAGAAGLDVISVTCQADLAFPLDAVMEALGARRAVGGAIRLIYLTDPNNPSGLGLPGGAIAAIAAAAPEALIFVDEAYGEFSGRTCIGRTLDSHPRVVVGRTFAKAHGLAGLRAGAAIGHPGTIAALGRVLPPFGLNGLAVRALEAAVEDRAHLDWYVAESAHSRQLIYDFCAGRGLTCWPSEANFVLIRIGDEVGSVVDALAARGILIRNRSGLPRCAGCVRITAGVTAHTRLCLDALEDILATRTN